MGTKANIVVGVQGTNTIKVGEYGENESAARDLGFIKGGVAIEKDETQLEIKVDQVLGTIGKVTTEISYKVTFSMGEATLANMALAFGLPTDSVAGSRLSIGAPTEDVEKTMYINVKGPGPGTRKYVFHKARPTGKTSPAYKRDEETLHDVEFEILYDCDQSAGEKYGYSTETGADTTAPTIVITSPAEAGTVVDGAKTIVTMTITETNGMNQSTIVYGSGDGATISIYLQGTPNTLVAGSITYDSTTKVVTFTPTNNWATETYQLAVTTGLKDSAGNYLAEPYLSYFTGA